MKIQLTFIFIMFIHFNCSKPKIYYDDLVKDGNLYKKKFSHKNISGDVYQKFDQNEVFMGKIKSGKREGIFTYWYENGRKKSECNYVEDKENGLHKYWYDSGVIRWETEYLYGLVNGVFKSYDQLGNIIYETHYKNDQEDGPSYFFHLDKVDTSWYDKGVLRLKK